MNGVLCRLMLPGALALACGSLVADERVLEEVVVTAQLRSESLQDVPVSVSALSGSKLTDAGIARIEDLQAYVPNLSMSETGIGTNIYIRGIGSGINQGFEQSVGMYVDGVYYGRAQLSRAPFLDIERVEVLRGPQNILYGKNSIAGAMSIITRRPGNEFEGEVSLTYEPRYNDRVVDAILSSPVTDTFGVRLAVREREYDGYVDNVDLGDDEPGRDELTARLVIDWTPVEALDVSLKLEKGRFDVDGRQIEIVGDTAVGATSNWGQLLRAFGASDSVLDVTQNGRRGSNGDFSDNDTKNATLTMNYQYGDYTITSITGYLTYDYNELCDCDFTGAEIFSVESDEEYRQFSQELRLTSPSGERLEWIAGAYYQDSDLDFNDNFFVRQSSILPNVMDAVLSSPGSPLFGVYPAGAAQQLRGISVPREFRQDGELWSAFLQGTWSFTDATRLTVGGRYSYEEKKASRILRAFNGGSELPYDDLFIPGSYMGIDYLIGAVLQTARHDLRGDREKDNFAPAVIVEHDLNADAMAYASWVKGYKAGGYDVRSNSPPDGLLIINPFTPAANVQVSGGAFDYDEEKAETYEVGVKTALADGAAEVNVAYFYTQYDDLQVSIFDGVLGFNVGNAARAVTQGIELDGRWQLTESLMLSGSLAWLDFEFKDYDNGQCTQRTRIETGNVRCDFAGKSNQYVADWSGVVSLDYRRPVANALRFGATLDAIFTTDYNPSQNLDPAIEQDGYVKLNGRLSLGAEDGGWEVALIGKNLTDEEIITYANDTPLSANLGQSTGYYTFVEPGATYALQGTWRF